jgi:hypothetical protein
MEKVIPLVQLGKSLTPYEFYTGFLTTVANAYEQNDEPISFKLIDGSDMDISQGEYYIDPISLPLLLSLAQSLKNFHGIPIKLQLSNTGVTIRMIEFLNYSDFFNIAGKTKLSTKIIGKEILTFDDLFIGSFSGKEMKIDHKIRCYSIKDNDLGERILVFGDNESSKRDFLVEYYSFQVKSHFYNLLYENELTKKLAGDFIEILSELISNGVLHSKSDTFALMFSDKYKTKFSISDNGIGLFESLKNKNELSNYYEKFELFELLKQEIPFKLPEKTIESLLSIFETIYFSMIKNRHGLFDLMCNVVLTCNGYFRLHTNNAQIIVSARMLDELTELYITRNEIIKIHNSKLFELISEQEWKDALSDLIRISKGQIINLAISIFKKYSKDTKFSAIRLFDVRFKGVHIEVEIPNLFEKQ